MIQNQETQNALLQEVNKLQFINNDLSQQLNACDQERGDWEYQFRMIKEKYEPAMECYIQWAKKDKFKCCECQKLKHKSNFSRYQLDRWAIHKKRCKPCEQRLFYKRRKMSNYNGQKQQDVDDGVLPKDTQNIDYVNLEQEQHQMA